MHDGAYFSHTWIHVIKWIIFEKKGQSQQDLTSVVRHIICDCVCVCVST